MTFAEVQELAAIAPAYLRMRREHPDVSARSVYAYLTCGNGESFAEFCCPGHRWSYTGTAYGGDDESYRGEGRVYCAHCGADGDA